MNRPMTSTTRKYNSIDLCKLIMAVCVVAIHTDPLNKCTNSFVLSIYNCMLRMAVPFFFLSSGFLLANKLSYPFSDDFSITKIKNYLQKIVKLYLIWNIVYLPLALYDYITANIGIKSAVFLYIRGLLFVGEHYNSWILWYLLSTIYALVLILFLLKRVHLKPEIIVVVGAVIYLLSTGISFLAAYDNDLPLIFSIMKKALKYTIINGRILTGSFYIPVGMLLARKKMNTQRALLMFIVGFVANIISNNYFIVSITLVVCSVGFFSIIKNIELPDSLVYVWARKMSTVIYFIHLYIWTFYYFVIYGEKTYGMDCFCATVILCITSAVIYMYAQANITKK